MNKNIDNINEKNANKSEASLKDTIIKEIFYYVKMIAIVLIASYVLKNKIIVNACIPTGSMESTIHVQDRVFGSRIAYMNKELERGDIVMFYAPDLTDGTIYIKRLIGLPGEKVTIKDSKIYINDSTEPLKEDYLNEAWYVKNDGYEFTVPENAYFFLGDNRNSSFDARYWTNTYVYRDAILAKAECIYYPFNNIKFLNDYKYE